MAMAAVPAKKKKEIVLRNVLMIIMSVTVTTAVADLRRLEHPAKPDGSLTFLVVGDWGRQGRFNQSQVALQMGVVGDKMDIDFVVSTGDNFYDEGLKGVGDPLFETSFSTVYNAKGLQKQWYNVMGNHDYRGNVEAQLSPLLTKIDSRWLCFRSFILNAEVVEIFFVDTTPMVDKYFTHPGDETYDWSGVLPRESYISDLLKDLDTALRESSAEWKIVVGHHTIKSAGHHGNTAELGARLLPILLENSVDFYVNGHDHCLQHISSTDSGLQFLTSGGGSKAWNGDVKRWKPAEMKFYYDGEGFMWVHLTRTHVQIRFYDVFGNVLHAWAASKPSHYSALS